MTLKNRISGWLSLGEHRAEEHQRATSLSDVHRDAEPGSAERRQCLGRFGVLVLPKQILVEHYAFGESGWKPIPNRSLACPARPGDGKQRESPKAPPMSALRADVLVVFDEDLVRPLPAAFADVQHGFERTGSKGEEELPRSRLLHGLPA